MDLMNKINITQTGETMWEMDRINIPNIPAVYFIYNDKKEVVYIGQTKRLLDRTVEHFRFDRWFKDIAKWLSYVETYPEDLRNKEVELIKEFKPCFNRRYN